MREQWHCKGQEFAIYHYLCKQRWLWGIPVKAKRRAEIVFLYQIISTHQNILLTQKNIFR